MLAKGASCDGAWTLWVSIPSVWCQTSTASAQAARCERYAGDLQALQFTRLRFVRRLRKHPGPPAVPLGPSHVSGKQYLRRCTHGCLTRDRETVLYTDTEVTKIPLVCTEHIIDVTSL